MSLFFTCVPYCSQIDATSCQTTQVSLLVSEQCALFYRRSHDKLHRKAIFFIMQEQRSCSSEEPDLLTLSLHASGILGMQVLRLRSGLNPWHSFVSLFHFMSLSRTVTFIHDERGGKNTCAFKTQLQQGSDGTCLYSQHSGGRSR